jgi:nickel-dependent lactate racemase
MHIKFPYPGYEQIAPLEVPDGNLMGVFSPKAYAHVDEKDVLEKGFANPIGAPRLRDAVKKGNRVLIITSS